MSDLPTKDVLSDVDREELRSFARRHSGEYPETSRRIMRALAEVDKISIYLACHQSVQRHQLERLGLAEEFGPRVGCDLADHLGEKLLEARAEVERLEREQAALIDLCVYRRWVRRPVTVAAGDGRGPKHIERWTSRVGNLAGQYHATEAEARASVRELIRGAAEMQAGTEGRSDG